MTPDEILDLVEDGTIEPERVSEFRELDDELQDAVANGEVEMDEI
jgi:hypothetical protein